MTETFIFDDGSKLTVTVEAPPPAARHYQPSKAHELAELIKVMAARWQRKRRGEL